MRSSIAKRSWVHFWRFAQIVWGDFVFYENFLKACNKRGVKPTPLLKKLEISSGNLEKWKNGASINSDYLCRIADELDCTSDYLLGRVDDPNWRIHEIKITSPSGDDKVATVTKANQEELTATEIAAIKKFINDQQK